MPTLVEDLTLVKIFFRLEELSIVFIWLATYCKTTGLLIVLLLFRQLVGMVAVWSYKVDW
jgi:hypothetical protein